jgi:hypothetical protein
VSEAYFREHAPQALVSELEKMIASATPPESFAPREQAPRAHRGKAVANRNAAGVAALRGMVPRG